MSEVSQTRECDPGAPAQKTGMYYGWKVLAAGTAITAVGSIQNSVTSVFFLPLQRELGLGRAVLSLMFSLAQIEGGIEGPLVGWLIDRHGAKIPILVGALLSGAGLIVLSTVHGSLGFLLVYLGLVSPGFQMGYLQCMHAVANIWFVKYRTRAMAILSSSVRLGPAVFTPLMGLAVGWWNWRTGAVLAGVLILTTAFPLSLLIRRSPESMGLLPDGGKPGEAKGGGASAEGTGTASPSHASEEFEFKEAIRTRAWWLLAITTTVRTSNNAVFGVHFVPIFVWKDLTELGAASLVGATQLLATPLILAVGWLGDRFSKKTILAWAHVSLAASFIVLTFVDSAWGLYVFMALFAFGANVAPANYSIIGDYFGRKSFARRRGVLNMLGVIGMGTTVLAGYIFDVTDSYAPYLLGTSAASAVAAVAVALFLRRPVKRGAGKAVLPART